MANINEDVYKRQSTVGSIQERIPRIRKRSKRKNKIIRKSILRVFLFFARNMHPLPFFQYMRKKALCEMCIRDRLEGDRRVYPGHEGETSLDWERKYNRFMGSKK